MSFVDSLEAARAYDRWFDHGWGKYAFAVESAALLRSAGPMRARRVIDVGCGTGRLTKVLADEGARPTGIDPDLSMLAVANERGVGNLICCDARRLPFSDASYDVAFAVTVCEFVEDVAQVFAELARVTVPHGLFVVGSLSPRSPWGLFERERFRSPPWTSARFLDRRELIRLGSRHGAVSLSSALYAWEVSPLYVLTGPALELLRHVIPASGAFQVLRVVKGA